MTPQAPSCSVPAVAGDPAAGAPAVVKLPISMEMIAAGVEVYRDWNPDVEDPETLVTVVFMAMRDCYFANSA